MKKKNIALIGFMGVGKTLVSIKLGEILDMEVISTDDLIIAHEQMPIVDIFSKKGEAYFRLLENKVVEEVCQKENVIIDCGGGVVLDRENFEVLTDSCCVVYLSATADTIFNNIKDQTKRPLLNVSDPQGEISRLLEERSAFYEKAEFVVDANSAEIEKIAKRIVDVVNERT